MKTLKTLAMGLAVVAVMSVTSVQASFTAIDGVGTGNSWSQQFNESGVGNFDHIEISWVTGSLFETPALTSFSAGWLLTPGGNTTFSSASGTPLTSLNFFINWGPASTPIIPTAFDFYAWDGNTLKEAVRATYTGVGGHEWDITPVPEPTTIIAGALLLLPLGASTLRILRKRQTA
jgi:hypothetical protein